MNPVRYQSVSLERLRIPQHYIKKEKISFYKRVLTRNWHMSKKLYTSGDEKY